MLRRLTLGLFTLACAAAIAACSSGTSVPSSGGVQGVGPNFVTNTIYVSDTTHNAIELYTPSPNASATPQYNIGGANTSLNGPSYMAFNSTTQLYVTNYNPSTKASALTAYQKFATGDVLPVANSAFAAGAQPHGIAMVPGGVGFAIAFTQPGGFFTSAVNVYSGLTGSSAFLSNTIAGANTHLNNPVGLAVDSNKNIYVANSGDSTVRVFALPSASPAPSVSPTVTPSPTPTPSTSPSTSPSPTPTPASNDIAPTTTITCTCFSLPTGLGLDSKGDVFVTDPGSKPPAVYEFDVTQIVPGTVALTPLRTLTASNMVNPTDVKIDAAGTVYVIDQGISPSMGKLFVFPSGGGAPTVIPLLGTATGMALSP